MSWFSSRPSWLAPALLSASAGIYLYNKIKQLSNEEHEGSERDAHEDDAHTSSSASAHYGKISSNSTASASSSSSSPSASSFSSSSSSSSITPFDPTLFPQYIRSLSTPSLWLYHRSWEVVQPRGVVFIIHGYGEHIGRYEGVATRLNSVGLSCYGLDHIGHGQSEGDRAHVKRFYDYVKDALGFVEYVQNYKLSGLKNKQIPCFLLGHSMGGLIAIEMMRASYTSPSTPSPLTHPEDNWPRRVWAWTGLILSAPAIQPLPETATPLLRSLAQFLSNKLPKLSLTGLDTAGISRLHYVTAIYNADPLVYHGKMRVRWGAEMLNTMDAVTADVPNFTFPMLILQGDCDRLVYSEGARYLHEHARQSKDKTLHVFPGAYHEVFNDLVAEEALKLVCEWIQKRIK